MSSLHSSPSLRELCYEIVDKHHEFIRQAGPELLRQARELAETFSEDFGVVKNLLEEMLFELESHMLKEESILFPLCQRLEFATERFDSHCGSVANPIRVMQADHELHAKHLETLRILTDNYSASAQDSPEYAQWLNQLKAFTDDLKIHIYKENELLFPRAIALEKQLA